MPSSELADTMRAECPGVDLVAQHRKFTDYWRAQPGQKGVKADWPATWRNWIRTAAERGPARAAYRNDIDWDAAMARAIEADRTAS